MINWKNLDQLSSFEALKACKPVCLKSAMAGENGAKRVKAYTLPMAAGLSFNYAAKAVDEEILEKLCALAKEAQLSDKYRALLGGEIVNTGEKRRVLHQLTRGQQDADVIVDGVNKREFYLEQLKKIEAFSSAVHAAGKIRRLLLLAHVERALVDTVGDHVAGLLAAGQLVQHHPLLAGVDHLAVQQRFILGGQPRLVRQALQRVQDLPVHLLCRVMILKPAAHRHGILPDPFRAGRALHGRLQPDLAAERLQLFIGSQFIQIFPFHDHSSFPFSHHFRSPASHTRAGPYDNPYYTDNPSKLQVPLIFINALPIS